MTKQVSVCFVLVTHRLTTPSKQDPEAPLLTGPALLLMPGPWHLGSTGSIAIRQSGWVPLCSSLECTAV